MSEKCRTFGDMKQPVGFIILWILLLIGCTTERQRTAMRQGLDSINVRNRTDRPFTVRDVEPYVRFFDDHGTPNDRLLAHYLLGRAYYEHGEAPMALQCYHDAIDCADTTAADCDFAQLSRVYAQMAEIFHWQGLYTQQLQHDKLSVKYAWLAKDTLGALMNYEQESFAYKGLGLTDSAIFVIEDVASKYEQFGYPQNGAIALGTIIRTLVNKGEHKKAKHYMDQYESESGFFNKEGEIVKGKERYYYAKGCYYQHCILDSAEYWYRKELINGKDFNNQNSAAEGLAMVYEQKHMLDSATKYYAYAYAMNDSMFAHTATQTIERMQSMYDYSRHQEEAYNEKEKANQRATIIWICLVIIVIICMMAYIIFRELSHKRHDAEQKYMQSLTAIEQAHHDITNLRQREDVNKELISEKEQIIREQETIMKSLLHRDGNSQSLADKKLKGTDIYNRFELLSVKGQQPTSEDWKQMEQHIFRCFPGFKEFLSKHEVSINEKEYKTCLLVRIGIKPTNIGSMLGVTASYITELRARMLQKLFGMAGSSKLFDKLLKEIY